MVNRTNGCALILALFFLLPCWPYLVTSDRYIRVDSTLFIEVYPFHNFDATMSMEPGSVSCLYIRRSHIIPASSPRTCEGQTINGTPISLKLSIHEYQVHGADPHGFTIVLTHGTSFNKYFWELIVNQLLSSQEIASKTKRFLAIDAVNHGDSAVLNRQYLPLRSMLRLIKAYQKF